VLQSLELNKYEFPKLIKWLQENIPANSRIYIEGKASGKSVIQTLKEQTNFNILEVQPRGSKLERKHSSSPYFESGRVIINSAIKYKQDLKEQLVFDNTAHDDALDVVTMAVDKMLKSANGVYAIR
jgi:predicted phage terminase large subunit-like protein